MKNIVDLNFGYSDAENYKRRENKEFFNRIFIRNQYLDLLCGPQTCFLMGEKGTGKTAYAVFCSNNEYKSTRSSVRYVRETDYQRFMTLKLKGLLDLSDYASIWKVILYLLLSQQVIECEGGASFLKRFTKMSSLQNAIDEYYSKAFNPEILQALQFATESKIAAELVAKYAHASGETKDTVSFSENRFQLNLFYLQKAFVAALGQLRLSKSHILFVDGIDVRPADVPFREYLTCVRGLASAIWEVNNDTFSTFKDRGGRLRVVLLVRPDIFGELGLQNLNTKARENAVYLDWRTEDKAYRTSELFQVVSKLVSVQQEPTIPPPGKAWDHYFPEQLHNSFVDLLRISYFRPRDLLTALTILREVTLEKDPHKTRFTPSDLANPTFRKKYSDYLLGEIKDHLVFYYSDEDYRLFRSFFEYLGGKPKFSFSEFLRLFSRFRDAAVLKSAVLPDFMESAQSFLQFLYSLNVISFTEKLEDGGQFIRWCYRERTYSNIVPRVKEGANYEVFSGLHKALNLGSAIIGKG